MSNATIALLSGITLTRESTICCCSASCLRFSSYSCYALLLLFRRSLIS